MIQDLRAWPTIGCTPCSHTGHGHFNAISISVEKPTPTTPGASNHTCPKTESDTMTKTQPHTDTKVEWERVLVVFSDNMRISFFDIVPKLTKW